MRIAFRVLCVAAMGLGVLAPAALAVPTLNGEQLSQFVFPSSEVGCQDDVVSYSVAGSADGPYPGTFTETGRLRIESHPNPMVPNDGRGPFSASFTIRSGALTITGTKSDPDAFGSCGGQGTIFTGDMPYSAQWTITKGNALVAVRGTYTDRGTSRFLTFGVGHFEEGYTSSQSRATLVRCQLVVAGAVAVPIPRSRCVQ